MNTSLTLDIVLPCYKPYSLAHSIEYKPNKAIINRAFNKIVVVRKHVHSSPKEVHIDFAQFSR